jgi:hypothetical protein
MALDRSILQRALLTVGLGLAAACATASLSQPVAEPVQGAPAEFRWLSDVVDGLRVERSSWETSSCPTSSARS